MYEKVERIGLNLLELTSILMLGFSNVPKICKESSLMSNMDNI